MREVHLEPREAYPKAPLKSKLETMAALVGMRLHAIGAFSFDCRPVD